MRTMRALLLGLLLLLSTGCADTVAVSAPSAVPSTGPGTTATVPRTTLVSGEGSIVTADGRTRTYRVHVPATLPTGATPLLVALHGGTGSARQFERSSGFDALADEHGFIVVYPDGVGSGPDEVDLRTWSAGLCCGAAARKNVDDVGFVRQLIDTVEASADIDRSRVFAAGHSNGGFMSYRLACELSDVVVAVGLQAGGLGVAECAPGRSVSLLHIHGTADTNVPIEGGVGSGISKVAFPPLADSLAVVTEAMGCATVPAESTDGTVATRTWSGCDDEVTVQLLLVDGEPHSWMTPPVFDSASTIVDFLLDHPRA